MTATTAKARKLCITLPADIADELRKISHKGAMSSVIATALRQYLTMRRQKKAIDESFGSWKDEDYPHLKTSEDVSRYVREMRQGYRRSR